MAMLLIKPFLGCNLACLYCYEEKYRRKNKPEKIYNLEAIFKRMEEFKNLEMSLHGGEALCLPKKDIKAILAKMHELTGKSSLQTNGTLIDDEYIKIFKKYKTSVGISWDGPGDLSAYRPGTAKVGSMIERLAKEGISVSLIMVLSKANAGTSKKLKKLKDYLLSLDRLRILGRINPCSGAAKQALSMEKLKEAYLDLANFCLHRNLKWSPFTDMINGLQGKSRVCTFTSCDIFSTPSAIVILGDGSVTNCMRTNQESIILRHPACYKIRDEILQEIPQEYGGCQDCQYWAACFGGCPASAIDDDWRNRTYLCPLWKSLFQFFEKVLSFCNITPISLKESEPDQKEPGHSDAGHGDSPHGDSHGDSG